jgi:Ca-activated chloride channel family protein
VTALYQVVPVGKEIGAGAGTVDALKYQSRTATPQAEASDELMTVKLRYKLPEEETSRKLVFPVADRERAFEEASNDFRFAAAVASFGMLLRDSEHKGKATADQVVQMARSARGRDSHGYRAEFVRLAVMYRDLARAGGS